MDTPRSDKTHVATELSYADKASKYAGPLSTATSVAPSIYEKGGVVAVETEVLDVPPDAGDRVARVVGQTAQLAAILHLAASARPRSGLSATGQGSVEAALDDLDRTVRIARMTALNAIVAESDRLPRR